MINTEWFIEKLDRVVEQRDKEGFKALVSDFDTFWKYNSVDADRVNRKIKKVKGKLNVPTPELEDLMSKGTKKKYLDDVR